MEFKRYSVPMTISHAALTDSPKNELTDELDVGLAIVTRMTASRAPFLTWPNEWNQWVWGLQRLIEVDARSAQPIVLLANVAMNHAGATLDQVD